MDKGIVARVAVTIDAPIAKVWEALVTPATIKLYMFGTTVVSDWKEGGSIRWKGEWKGQLYEDKGVIVTFEPQRRLRFTHYSPLSGLPDVSDSYHTVTMELSEQAGRTHLALAQDNNATEQERQHSEQNWTTVLQGLTKVLEG